MNAAEGLWRQWSSQLRAFLPDVHGHRSQALAFGVLGVVLAGTRRLPRVAEALVGVRAATTPSSERRLSRCLANQQIIVVPLWTRLIGHCRHIGVERLRLLPMRVHGANVETAQLQSIAQHVPNVRQQPRMADDLLEDLALIDQIGQAAATGFCSEL